MRPSAVVGAVSAAAALALSGAACAPPVQPSSAAGIAQPVQGPPSTSDPVVIAVVRGGEVPALGPVGRHVPATDLSRQLRVVTVDSASDVVTGVVAGRFDLGATETPVPLLAIAEGAPLRVVAATEVAGSDPGAGATTVVARDSDIASWSDLVGKRIGCAAVRSMCSLSVPAAAGGDRTTATGVQIVPLPAAEISNAVADGIVDAGVVPTSVGPPVAADPDLRALGDSVAAALPPGTVTQLLFGSRATSSARAAVVDRAVAALRTVPAADGERSQRSRITDLDSAALQPVIDLLVTYRWLRRPLDAEQIID